MRLRGSLCLTVLALVFPANADDRHRDRLQVVEATIADIHHQFRSGDLTPEDLVKMYLARIAAYDQPGPQAKIPQTLNSFMHVNENAVADARALKLDDFDGEDSEDEDGPRKPLFGIPVILKDNIDTADLPTTAGSVALGDRSRNTMPSSPRSCAAPGPSSSGRRRSPSSPTSSAPPACRPATARSSASSSSRLAAIRRWSDMASTRTIPAPIRGPESPTAGRRCRRAAPVPARASPCPRTSPPSASVPKLQDRS